MKFPEQFRYNTPKLPQYHADYGSPFGRFCIPGRNACGRALNVIAVDGEETGWEHVSVSLDGQLNKTPSWNEMCLLAKRP